MALRWLVVLCALVLADRASARPFTIDDFLRLESLGPGVIDPSGRWLIQEFEPRYDQSPRFDNDVNFRPIHARLLRVNLQHPSQAEPAFPQSNRGGYVAGPFSPHGRYMVVHRNLDRRWEIGVLELATRKVRWLGFGAEFADKGDTLVWRSETRLLALRMPAGGRYWKETLQQDAMARLPALWRSATLGQGSTGVLQGTGRYDDIHLPYPPRQVVEVDAMSGHVRAFVSGVFDQIALSPNGNTLALVGAYGRVEPSGDELLSQGTQFRHFRLQLLDLETGALITPCDGELLASSLRWSPASDQLLVYGRPIGAPWTAGAYRRVTTKGACQKLDIAGVEPSITLETEGAFTVAHVEWIGADPMILGSHNGGARPDWFALTPAGPVNLTAHLQETPSDPVLMTAEAAVFVTKGRAVAIDRKGSLRSLGDRPITRVLTPTRPNMTYALPEDGAARLPALFALTQQGAGVGLARITEAGVTLIGVSPHPPQRVVTAGAAGLVTITIDAHGVQSLTLVAPSGRETTLYSANRNLAGVELANAKEIDHTGPQGEALKSWLFLPAHVEGERPPLLVMAYPGARYDSAPRLGEYGFYGSLDDNAQIAVGHGYAVLVPSLPGSESSTDPGKGWDRQILSVVDAVKQTNLVDTDRLAFWGHSFGGYVALMLATQTDRFRAIISSAPMSDLVSMRGQGWPSTWLSPYDDVAVQSFAGWSERGAQGHLMGTPWTARERFIENSPVFFANRIRTPILLVQGDQDPVNIAQGREMFSDLGRLGNDSMLLTFYGESHNIVSPPNVRLFADSAYKFLDEHLKP